MTTVGDVLGWTPNTLTTGAASVKTMGDALARHVSTLKTESAVLKGGWQGVAADRAIAALDRRAARATDIGKAFDTTESAMRSGASALTTARSNVEKAVQEATSHGYTVGDDGAVTPPAIPPSMTSTDPAAVAKAAQQRAAESAKLTAQAQTYADAIAAAVQAAVDADGKVAGTLTVTLPHDAATELAFSVAAAKASTPAQMAVLAMAGKNVWGGFEAAKNLTTFMGRLAELGASDVAMTAGFARESSTMLGWSLGHGIQAENAIRETADLLRYGKTQWWVKAGTALAEKAGGSAAGLESAGKLVGRIALPLTVVTGLKDLVFGAGHHGARDVVDRVMGGAGAAGAASLLGATALGLGPVGIGIAGAAVTAYGLWQAGSYLHDHWDTVEKYVPGAKQATDAVKSVVSSGVSFVKGLFH